VDADEENTVLEQAPNTNRDPMNVNNITKFGVARVEKFLKFNGISMILRSH
jgi:hypothetical protein